MPRDGSGNYTLPAGNPVVSGTVIDVTWANPTMSDVAVALTDSLSRTGSGGMLVPFLNADGAVGSPGISWVNETTSGIYRAGLNDQRWASSGVDKVQVTADASNPLLVWNVGDASFRAVVDVFSPATILGIWIHQGDVTMDGAALITDDSTAARAGLNVPTGIEPTVPAQGDIWVEAANIFCRLNGVNESLIGSNAVGASAASDRMLRGDGSGGWVDAGANATLSSAGIMGMFDVNLGGDLTIITSGNQISMGVTAQVAHLVSIAGTIDYFRTDEAWRFVQTIFLGEQGFAAADVPGFGQIWVDNTVPNTLNFDDDDGNSYKLSGKEQNTTLIQSSFTNDTVLANITGLTGFQIKADVRYKFRIVLHYEHGAGDIKVRPDVSQTPQDNGWRLMQAFDFSGTFESDMQAAFGTNAVATTMIDGQPACMIVEGSFHAHATLDGTMNIQAAQQTSNGTPTTIEIESWCEVMENDNF